MKLTEKFIYTGRTEQSPRAVIHSVTKSDRIDTTRGHGGWSSVGELQTILGKRYRKQGWAVRLLPRGIAVRRTKIFSDFDGTRIDFHTVELRT